jgi:TPP-dependent 2-oxoacid decarboxylase
MDVGVFLNQFAAAILVFNQVLIIHIYSIQNRGRNTFEVLLHHALPHSFFTYLSEVASTLIARESLIDG